MNGIKNIQSVITGKKFVAFFMMMFVKSTILMSFDETFSRTPSASFLEYSIRLQKYRPENIEQKHQKHHGRHRINNDFVLWSKAPHYFLKQQSAVKRL